MKNAPATSRAMPAASETVSSFCTLRLNELGNESRAMGSTEMKLRVVMPVKSWRSKRSG
jgi:hypothetical protein